MRVADSTARSWTSVFISLRWLVWADESWIAPAMNMAVRITVKPSPIPAEATVGLAPFIDESPRLVDRVNRIVTEKVSLLPTLLPTGYLRSCGKDTELSDMGPGI